MCGHLEKEHIFSRLLNWKTIIFNVIVTTSIFEGQNDGKVVLVPQIMLKG
jgi:hypothetical protein